MKELKEHFNIEVDVKYLIYNRFRDGKKSSWSRWLATNNNLQRVGNLKNAKRYATKAIARIIAHGAERHPRKGMWDNYEIREDKAK